ncbi:MAG: PQQ-binding-like beta-propeller repeat protein, partial [Aureliella sp.]
MTKLAAFIAVFRLPTTLSVLVLSLALPVLAEETNRGLGWSCFRGENGVGSIASCDVPLPWQPIDVAWELSLPGNGNASPVLWGDLAFVSSADIENGEQHLIAIEISTGLIKWQKAYPSRTYSIHLKSSFASSTPCANDAAV